MDRLPQVGTDGYEKLGYQDKLFILNLYLFDRDKYRLLVGYGKSSGTGFYVEQRVSHLASSGKLGVPPDDTVGLVSIEENYWGAYLCFFDQAAYGRDILDLLSEFGIQYERTLGINLFSFPVLRTDFLGKEILNWVFNSELGMVAVDPVFSLVTMRLVCDMLVPNAPARVLIAKRAKTKTKLRALMNDPVLIKQNMTPVTIDDISIITNDFLLALRKNEGFDYSTSSIIDMAGEFLQPSALFDDMEVEDLVLLANKCKKFGKWWYAPILPVGLFKGTRFTVKDWAFLYPASNGNKP